MVMVDEKKLTDIENYVDGAIEPHSGVDLIREAVKKSKTKNQRSLLIYVILPVIYLVATLLGGLRLGAADSAFIFLKPPLISLVFGALTLVLFIRSGLIELGGWFSDEFSGVKNTAGAAVLLTLFTATVQLFNSLLPEQGLPFWIIGFCFFWTIWNNLFAELDNKRLLRSMVALFGLAFVVKYLLLVNLTAPPDESWLRRVIENPGREAFTWLLDLPQYAAGTGYIQFFTIALYLIGLVLTPRSTKE
ncbi:MAG TPA: hypothetical protein VNA17_09190 [Pyrinomonadaceae bacterium]|nr:hypothetical protein [Pyrinomonadaceae bacterium]